MGVPIVGPLMVKLLGSRNSRLVKRYLRLVDQINQQESVIRSLTDAELCAKSAEFRAAFTAGRKSHEMIPDVFAVAREAMDRGVGIRNIFNPAANFDAGLLSGEARRLHDQTLAQMRATEPRAATDDLKGGHGMIESWQFVDIPNEVYEAVRALHPHSKPPFRARPFDVQLIGGMVLSEGRIAEMKTGEGKTIVGPLACYLASLQGLQVHVVTVNDYLVQRDRDWTFPFFRALGLTVGAIHPIHIQSSEEKKTAYECDVVYGTTSEFGFDYLRDNMKLRSVDQVQKTRQFAIVDEVDSILIDEARTPLIISGPAHSSKPRYDVADQLARHLQQMQSRWSDANEKVQSCRVEMSSIEGDIRNTRDKESIPTLKIKLEEARKRLPRVEAERDKYTQYYEVELDKKKASLTHDGIAEAQRKASLGSFYVGENIDLPHLLENALRSHVVYQRDRDYVVAPDEDGQLGVVIVDQNTGRKMVGRQWSDGLHQAVEAKEGVRIKDETQTMATITIQNYFKLYQRLAGMTGTADTEATEFYEIYRLDVVSIPTNLPVVRVDRNDLVFVSLKDKWESIIEEIKRLHDVGRPILVGTTSVEKSETLSRMLTQKYGIRHEVLNAKQHEREADIVAGAGQLGAVMIATNMAGRGTDIKLVPLTAETLIEHWKKCGICPKEVTASTPEAEAVAAIHRFIAPRELDLKKSDVDAMSDGDVHMALLRHWAITLAMADPKKACSASEAHLVEALDSVGNSLMHRIRIFRGIEEMGGLHIIGTERHESRRIDNQLRGRSGRQGDNGSSRFFLSLEDDLMKMFAGNKTLSLLSKLGMKEGDAMEHPILSNAVERAQRKVEERNFQIRKNILDFDEPMEHQRRAFYSTRQRVLEGRDVKGLIFDYIEDAVFDAAQTHLHPLHRAKCIAEWASEHLSVTIEPKRLQNKDREDTYEMVLRDALQDATERIRVTLGEYVFDEAEPSDWDVKGLADWARTTYKIELDPEELRGLSPSAIRARISAAAEEQIQNTDLAPLDRFLTPDFGEEALASWANTKFGGGFTAGMFSEATTPQAASEGLLKQAREVYREREIVYPIDFAIDMTSSMLAQNPQAALHQFCAWITARYELDWKPESLPSSDPRELRRLLVEEANRWDTTRIAARAERALAAGRDVESLDRWFSEQCMVRLSEYERSDAAADPAGFARRRIAEVLRTEISQFETWVLLQILDSSWKDHLHSMDQIRDSIGFRAFSQKDPRIEFKREASKLFQGLQETIRDKVTDLVFKGRLAPQVPRVAPPTPGQAIGLDESNSAVNEDFGGDDVSGVGTSAIPSPATTGGQSPSRGPVPQRTVPAAGVSAVTAAAELVGTAAQRRDLEIAERAGTPEGAAPAGAPAARSGGRRAPVAVGRNEPCPCGSGKKYKQCHGRS
mgnify:CR=1 FL=1